jgi:hypothetical protein
MRTAVEHRLRTKILVGFRKRYTKYCGNKDFEGNDKGPRILVDQSRISTSLAMITEQRSS